LLERIHVVADLPTHLPEMRSHERNVTHDTNASQPQTVNKFFKTVGVAVLPHVLTGGVASA
jgi:hypothetical protein